MKTKSILLYYKCPCGNSHDITWELYKTFIDKKLDCYCDLINDANHKTK